MRVSLYHGNLSVQVLKSVYLFALLCVGTECEELSFNILESYLSTMLELVMPFECFSVVFSAGHLNLVLPSEIQRLNAFPLH